MDNTTVNDGPPVRFDEVSAWPCCWAYEQQTGGNAMDCPLSLADHLQAWHFTDMTTRARWLERGPSATKCPHCGGVLPVS